MAANVSLSVSQSLSAFESCLCACVSLSAVSLTMVIEYEAAVMSRSSGIGGIRLEEVSLIGVAWIAHESMHEPFTLFSPSEPCQFAKVQLLEHLG